jgi:thiamine pyrophosphate-dependent acetolactate synthase large subunit-like protein
VAEAVELLGAAKRPVILAGRVSRSESAWQARVALAERLNAQVVTDLKAAAAFPTDHPLHAGAPSTIMPVPEALEALRAADLILSLDWIDVAGTLNRHVGEHKARIIQITMDHQLHNGWSFDYQGLPPVDVFIPCEPDTGVAALREALGSGKAGTTESKPRNTFEPKGDKLGVDHVAVALRRALGDRPVTLAHLPLSWNGETWPFRHPLDFLGSDGGGGLGAGPGVTVGAALALKDSERIVVGICGDGDFLMGVTALWTATHYRIPLLIVVANNRSFFNDELHQERVARMRNRPVENRWVGQRISEPDIDLAAMARAQGAQGFGPVTSIGELPNVLAKAIAAVDAGEVAVVDARVEPGYSAAMTAAMSRKE